MASLTFYKFLAGKVADETVRYGAARGAKQVLNRRRTKGAKAALIGALVVGALIERGKADLAEHLTIELTAMATEED